MYNDNEIFMIDNIKVEMIIMLNDIFIYSFHVSYNDIKQMQINANKYHSILIECMKIAW